MNEHILKGSSSSLCFSCFDVKNIIAFRGSLQFVLWYIVQIGFVLFFGAEITLNWE